MQLEPLRQRTIKKFNAYKNERQQGWDGHYQQLARNFLPRAGRFFTGDRNQGGDRWNNIIDSSGPRALRVMAAGMMAGMTSPARPWFALRTPDEDLNKNPAVRQWLQDVTKLMLLVFQRSNTYNALHTLYRELGVFGTAASFVGADFDNVIHNYPATAGEYALAMDNRMQVNAIYREFEITLDQAAQWNFNLSEAQRLKVDTGRGDEAITLIHAVEPNPDRDPRKRDSLNMPFRSLYLDQAGDSDRILAQGGFRTFPALCPRWDVTSTDTYGWSPGMEALGDVLQLQQEQFRKSEAIDYKARPPLQVPTALRERDSDLLPGGVSFYDAAAPNGGIRTAFEVQLDVNELMLDIQDIRQRLNSAFYVDVFLMLTSMQDPRMTATEVAERHEEKLLMLGPVLERLHSEMLNPLIEATFARIMEVGIAPPIPNELSGIEIQVEFVSMLAQAQRAISVNSTDRFVANLGSIAAIKPEILDRFNPDGWVEHYSDVLGVDASLVIPMETAMLVREQRAQQMQAQQQIAASNAQADTALKTAQAAQAAGIDLPTGLGYAVGASQTSGAPLSLQPGAGV